jgi:hypothetical protein
MGKKNKNRTVRQIWGSLSTHKGVGFQDIFIIGFELVVKPST